MDKDKLIADLQAKVAELEKELDFNLSRFMELYNAVNRFPDKPRTTTQTNAEPVAWIKNDTLIFLKNYTWGSATIHTQKEKDEEFTIPLYTTPQTKPLSDEEMNKAFDYYCESDEGVLRFDYELRKEWKEKELQRWKDAFAWAIEERILGK